MADDTARTALGMRRAELVERYGPVTSLGGSTADVLRMLGKRDEIHPRDATAIRYPSLECAQAYAALNAEHNPGIDVIGPVETPDGVVAVLDLRRSLAAVGTALTDPALPDEARRHPATAEGGGGDD